MGYDETKKVLSTQDAIIKGYKFKCLRCGVVYKEKPKQNYTQGRTIEMCHCGSDLFKELKGGE